MKTDPASPARSLASKYREVIIAILIFIFLDVGVLALNYMISFQIQHDAVAVNLAGRQRMLSQRTVKALYQLQVAEGGGIDTAKALEELKGAFELFDTTLTAFSNGGNTKGGDGKPLVLPKVDDAAARTHLEEATQVWIPYRAKIAALLENPHDLPAISSALTVATTENLKLLQLMNQFTFALEQRAQKQASTMRMIQTVALVLVLINFVVIIVHVIGKLKRSDLAVEEFSENLKAANLELGKTNLQLEATTAELSSAKQESDTIFSTVRQGLFLIDRELRIGSQISEELKSIFQTDQLEGRNVLHLLKPLITEKQFTTVEDFFQLLLDPSRREKHLVKFNPLKRIESNFAQGEKGFLVKHLEFTFQRILGPASVDRVLVTVTDVTERVNLSERLKAAEEKKEKQFELLVGILHIEPFSLANFIQQTNTEIGAINAVLQEDSSSHVTRAKLDRIFRSIHNIKGNAAILGLEPFQKLTHRMEDKLNQLRTVTELSGQDFLPVVVDLADLQNLLDELSELASRLAGLRKNFVAPVQAAPASPADALVSSLESLGMNLASKFGKKVRFECYLDGFDALPNPRRELVKDTLIQLVRNSLVHGIESPSVRRQLGKSIEGVIYVECTHTRNGVDHFVVNYRDDGAGLHLDRIRSRLIQSGIAAQEQAERLSDQELCGFIFEPGFSTAERLTEDAGRGVGLDIIKTRVVDEIGGEINFDFVPHQYCAFSISLPA